MSDASVGATTPSGTAPANHTDVQPVEPGHQCVHDLRFTRVCIRADLAANNSAISKVVLLVYRVGHLLAAGKLPAWLSRAGFPVYRAVDLVWCKLLAGCELGPVMCAGPGIYLAHGGRGVVISDGVVIGERVSLYHQVSIGWQETQFEMEQPPVPVIGDRARIGTGARVMGGVRVGEDAMVGANAVVFRDVPPGSTAAGNPARILTPPKPAPDAAGSG